MKEKSGAKTKKQGMILAFTPQEIALLKSLDTPQKLQAYLDSIPPNFEPDGDECRSPILVLRTKKAHCIEAAMFAAVVLRMQGRKAHLLDLTANSKDDDHVIALFQNPHTKCWGAIAKSNHYCNGYRDPVYASVRELVMSYFHEYLNYAGEKTLRSYAGPLDLAKLDSIGWLTRDGDVWEIPNALVALPHHSLMTPAQERALRPADEFIRRINNIPRYRKGSKRQSLPRAGMKKSKGKANM
jgi:hypothetical protein